MIYHGTTEIENTVSQLPCIDAHETNLTTQKNIYKKANTKTPAQQKYPIVTFYLWGVPRLCTSWLCVGNCMPTSHSG